jgi:peptidoglycan DL-endopeptidase CwlO
MSAISSINNSLTSSLLSSLLSGSTSSAGTSSASTASDIVSLLGGSSSSSDSSLYSALTGTSGSTSTADPMYGILLSAESASLMQSNPALTKEVTAAEQASAASGSSSTSTSTQSLVSELQNMNLLTASPDTLLSIIKNAASNSASTINTTA